MHSVRPTLRSSRLISSVVVSLTVASLAGAVLTLMARSPLTILSTSQLDAQVAIYCTLGSGLVHRYQAHPLHSTSDQVLLTRSLHRFQRNSCQFLAT